MSRPRASAPLASPDEIEQQFYEALQRADIEQLMRLWSDDDEISCVHPGGPRLNGAAAIRATFASMFANGPVDVQPQQVRRLQTNACAVHGVLERVRHGAADDTHVAWVVATNVYVQTALGWRLVSHHASPGFPREPHENAPPPAVLH